jgi:hypothetical protein
MAEEVFSTSSDAPPVVTTNMSSEAREQLDDKFADFWTE